MRVIHFIDSLNMGGTETLTLDVCRNASRLGLDVTLVTCNGGTLQKQFEASGVEIVRLPRRLPIDPMVVQGLRRVIKERGARVVHGHQAVDGIHLYMATRGMPDVKTVLSYHGYLTDVKNRVALKMLIPRVDANIVVSEGLKDWLHERDGLDTSKLKVLYNGVDSNRLQPTGRSVRRELGIPDVAPLAGMVGNFYRDPRKDQLTVVKALPRVFERLPDTHFVFAGRLEPGAEDKLAKCKELCAQTGITDHVHFLGPRSDVPDILTELDLFVISSLQEGLPIAFNEAMLAGTAVLASDIGPHIEASDGGQYAELFETQNESELAEKMIALLTDAQRREVLAAKALYFANETFSIDAHLKRLVSLYDSLFTEEAGR
jgi:L-malate glycosyltransferase